MITKAPGEYLFDAVQADPELSALLGDRFYPDMPEQAVAYPQAMYESVDVDSNPTFDSSRTSDMISISIQIWGETYLQANAVMNRMIIVFDRMRGPFIMQGVTAQNSAQNAPERDRNFASFTGEFFQTSE